MTDAEPVENDVSIPPADANPPAGGRQRASQIASAILVWVIILALLAGLVWLVVLSWPSDLPEPKDPSWIDSIFASKPVLFAARLLLFAVAVVLVFGGIYTVVSIVSWMQRGHWLRRIGPFEVAEQAVSQLTNEIQDLQELAEAAQTEIEDLKGELAETQALADHFYDRWQEAETGATTTDDGS